eukprot:3557869-Amphidinium_carterae.1
MQQRHTGTMTHKMIGFKTTTVAQYTVRLRNHHERCACAAVSKSCGACNTSVSSDSQSCL